MITLISSPSQKVSHFPFRAISWIASLAIAACISGSIQPYRPLSFSKTVIETKPTLLNSVQLVTNAQMEEEIFARINTVRLKHGLKMLKHNAQLSKVARTYSKQMADYHFFGHVGIKGSTLLQRMQSEQIGFWVAGENLYMGTHIDQPPPEAVKGWMASPGHRKVILYSIFTDTGVGVWRANNTYYITQLFSQH